MSPEQDWLRTEEVAQRLGWTKERVLNEFPRRKIGGIVLYHVRDVERELANPTPPKPRSAVLYRFFDDAGRLLYVGITVQGPARWASHAAKSYWWDEVASATIEHYIDVETCRAAELRAIADEDPLYNSAGRR